MMTSPFSFGRSSTIASMIAILPMPLSRARCQAMWIFLGCRRVASVVPFGVFTCHVLLMEPTSPTRIMQQVRETQADRKMVYSPSHRCARDDRAGGCDVACSTSPSRDLLDTSQWHHCLVSFPRRKDNLTPGHGGPALHRKFPCPSSDLL